VVNIKDLIN